MANGSENNSWGGRMRRYARVSGTVGGLAARLAGERYLGIRMEREKHAAEIKEALGNLRGPLVKVAQMLATIPEALPKEYVQELQQLQANAPPMGWSFVKRRMIAEMGPDWRKRFKSFDREAAAAASLGQVHKATALDGELLACKLQYPDMQSAVEADLRQLRMFLGLFERYDKAFSTREIQKELGARLREELDYEQEAKHCALYHDILSGESAVSVPKVRPELSTRRLLTTNWLEGRPVLEFRDADLEVRNQLAMCLFRAWYVPLYYYGVIHGDPHLGNYSVREDHTLNLLDFGCVRVFPPAFVGGVIELYHALRENDEERAIEAYRSWGFKSITRELASVLNVWANFIYQPLMDDSTRPIGETNNGIYGRETAEKVHKELRKAGGVEVPREFVFMDRAALGLGSVFLHLKADINWYRLFNEMIEGFDEKALADRQAAALGRHGLTGDNPDVALAPLEDVEA